MVLVVGVVWICGPDLVDSRRVEAGGSVVLVSVERVLGSTGLLEGVDMSMDKGTYYVCALMVGRRKGRAGQTWI